MPYSSISDLPESIRNALPEAAQKLFLEVVNAALKQYNGDEAKSFATAWSAVKKQYTKLDDKWVRQESDGRLYRQLRLNFSSGKFQEVDGGLLVKNVKLLANGTWTDDNLRTPIYYPLETLRNYAGNWFDNSIWSRHYGRGDIPREITDKIGEIQNPHFDTDAIVGDIFLHGKTQKSKDTIELVKAYQANFVSVEHGGKEFYNSVERRYEAGDLIFGGATIVPRGACKVCTIQNNQSITGDVRQLADKYSKEDMGAMLDFMKANPGIMDKGMMDKMYATMDSASKKESMKSMLGTLKEHPEMMDDEMKGMMKGMMGGKEMSGSLSAEAEMMELKELEAKFTETERQLAESTAAIKIIQEASASKDTKIAEFEKQLGESKTSLGEMTRQLGEAVKRIEKIEKTPDPQTHAGSGSGLGFGKVEYFSPISVKDGEISMERI